MIIAVLGAARLSAQSVVLREEFGVPDGSVSAIHETGGRILIGGRFSYIGMNTGGVALLDSNGIPDPAYTGNVMPMYGDYIGVAVPDGAGGFFVGGRFHMIGGYTGCAGIARLLADGRPDTTWTANVKGTFGGSQGIVNAIVVTPTHVYVGGDFNLANGATRNNLAAFDLATGQLHSTWDPNLDQEVNALTVSGNKVYAGGYFEWVNGNTPRDRLAAFELAGVGATGQTDTSWNPRCNNRVLAIAVVSNAVYVGGNFDHVGGLLTQGRERNYLAAFEIANGTNLGVSTGWNPDASAPVNAMTVSGTTIYVGGGFTTLEDGATARTYAAAIDANGTIGAWAPQIGSGWSSPGLSSLVMSGTTIYVAGMFNEVEGEVRDYIAAIDTAGTLLPWNPGANAAPNTIATTNGHVLAVGGFTSMGSIPRQGIAAIDKASGQLDPSWAPDIGWGNVWDFAEDANFIYIAGEFNEVDGVPRKSIAALNKTTGAVDPDWNPNPGNAANPGDICQVWCARVHNGVVYFGGNFDTVRLGLSGEISRDFLVAVEAVGGGASGLPIVTWDPAPSVDIEAVEPVSDGLLIRSKSGQQFTVNTGQATEVSRGGIAKVELAEGGATGDVAAWDPDPDDPGGATVFGWALSGNSLYICGKFETLKGGTVNRQLVAEIDIATGDPTPWQVDFGTNYYAATDIAVDATTAYLTGYIFDVNGASRYMFAGVLRSDGSQTTALDIHPDQPAWGDDGCVYATGSEIYFGGGFGTLFDGTVVRPHFAVFYLAPAITTLEDLPEAQIGQPYDQALDVDGFGPFTWALGAGAPAWLSVTADGHLTGTPGASDGNHYFEFSVTVTDQGSAAPAPNNQGTANFRLVVEGGSAATPLATGFEPGQFVPTNFTGGAAARYRYTSDLGVGNGAMLILDAPPATADWTLAQSVADDPAQWPGDPDYASALQWSVTSGGATGYQVGFDWLAACNTLFPWKCGLIFEVSDDGGVTWRIFSDGGANTAGIYRPAGLVTPADPFNTASITVTGLAAAVTHEFRFRTLVDSSIDDVNYLGFLIDNLTIGPPPPPVIVLEIDPLGLDPATAGLAYSFTLTATGGTQPYQWNINGLPDGLSLDTTTGVISGTPAAASVGSHNLAVSVTDAAAAPQTAQLLRTLVVQPGATTGVGNRPPASGGGLCALHEDSRFLPLVALMALTLALMGLPMRRRRESA